MFSPSTISDASAPIVVLTKDQMLAVASIDAILARRPIDANQVYKVMTNYSDAITVDQLVALTHEPKMLSVLVQVLGDGKSETDNAVIETIIDSTDDHYVLVVLNEYLKSKAAKVKSSETKMSLPLTDFTLIYTAAVNPRYKSLREHHPRFSDPTETLTEYLDLSYPEPHHNIVDICANHIGKYTLERTTNLGVSDVVYSLKFPRLSVFQAVVRAMLSHRKDDSPARIRVIKYVLMDAVLKACQSNEMQYKDRVLWLINELNYLNCLAVSGHYEHYEQIQKYKFKWTELKCTSVITNIVITLNKSKPCKHYNVIKFLKLFVLDRPPSSSLDLLTVLKCPLLHEVYVVTYTKVTILYCMISNTADNRFKHECMNTAAKYDLIYEIDQMINKKFPVPGYVLRKLMTTNVANLKNLKISENFKSTPSGLLNDIIKVAVDNDYPHVIKQHVKHYTGDRDALLKYVVKMPSVDVATIAAVLQ